MLQVWRAVLLVDIPDGEKDVNCHECCHLYDLKLGDLWFGFLTPANHSFFFPFLFFKTMI